jgi:hypothetical protein
MTSKKGKIAVIGLAGAITGVCVWAAKAFADVVVPTETAVCIQVIVVAVVQYFLPDEMEG